MSAHLTPVTAEAAAPRVMHDTFSWLHESLAYDRSAQFAALTRDVVRGAELCAQVAHSDLLGREEGRETLFSIHQIEHLSFLARRSLQMLGDEAERIIEAANEKASGVQS